jgi:hypothetical protein
MLNFFQKYNPFTNKHKNVGFEVFTAVVKKSIKHKNILTEFVECRNRNCLVILMYYTVRILCEEYIK